MSEQLGSKLKRLREDKKMTIQEMSDTSGIHHSQLELIERGEQVPAMAVLIKIARALQVRLGTILDGEEHAGPAMSKIGSGRQVVSLSNDKSGARQHLHFQSLAQGKTDRNMDPLVVDVSYCTPSADKLSNHEGEEFLYVLEGEIELRYGSEIYPLKAGESIYYDSLVPHCVSTPSQDSPTAKVMAVMYTPY